MAQATIRPAFCWIGLLSIVVAITGCGDDQEASGPVARDSASTGRPVDSKTSTAEISVRVVDETELASAIEGHRGKVVLVDFWATWCTSCVKLFPHTVELHEKLGPEGLEVISVSLDDPENEEAVLRFLRKQGARFDNFISRYGAGPESFEKLGLPGMLPQLRLYDRAGNPAGVFPEPQKPVEATALDSAVRACLMKKSPQNSTD